MNSRFLFPLLFIFCPINVLASQAKYEWSAVSYPLNADTAVINNKNCCRIEALNEHDAIYFGGGRSILLIRNDGYSILTKNIYDSTLNDYSFDSSLPFNAFDFADDQNGYIAGGNSTIYKTTDGGQTWKCSLRGQISGGMGGPSYEPELLSVSAYDSNNVWAVGKAGLIVHTTNGGKNWEKSIEDRFEFSEENVYWLSAYDFQSIAVVDDKTCFIAGNCGDLSVILETTDGGIHWKEVAARRFGQKIVSIAFSGDMLWIMTDFIIYHGTFDAGSNTLTWDQFWETLSTRLQSFIIVDSTLIMSIDTAGFFGYVKYDTLPLVIAATSRDLRICTISSSQTGGALWAATANRTIYRSTNHGQLWNSSIKNGFYPRVRLNTVCFTDPQNGYIGGDRGVLFITNDSGKTWTPSSTTVCASLSFESIHFTTANDGWVVGTTTGGGKTYSKTSDGGKNWQIADSATGVQTFRKLNSRTRFSISVDTFLTLGTINGESRIFTETNGGRELLAVVDHSDSRNNEFTSITFSDKNTGWVVGDNGLILKSADHGSTWIRQPTFTQSRLEKISFLNPELGIILGSKSILFSSDSGSTWDEVPILSGDITDITFSDSMDCWAVGENGLILNLKISDVPLTVLNPLRNVIVAPGDSLTIKWQGTNIDRISILISYDNGRNYTTYIAETDNDGEERVRISANFKSGDSCIVIIRNLDGSAQAQSEPFTIRGIADVRVEAIRPYTAHRVRVHGSIINYYSPALGTPIRISIFNPLGRNIYSRNFLSASSGEKTEQIPAFVLKNGFYMVRLVIGGNVFMEQFVVFR